MACAFNLSRTGRFAEWRHANVTTIMKTNLCKAIELGKSGMLSRDSRAMAFGDDRSELNSEGLPEPKTATLQKRCSETEKINRLNEIEWKHIMKKTNLLPLGLMAAAALALPTIGGAAISIGIENSPHDFSTVIGTNKTSTASWNSRHGVCSPCHSAHHTDDAQIVPLWNHATTTGPFIPYSSPSLNASVGAPDGVSLACLSCHDGTLAVNAGSGAPRFGVGTDLDVNAKIGPDLHVVHPISFTYDAALAAADGNLE